MKPYVCTFIIKKVNYSFMVGGVYHHGNHVLFVSMVIAFEGGPPEPGKLCDGEDSKCNS